MAKGGKGGNSDTISGNKRANLLVGTDADETLIGKGGDDTLQGQGGADTILGGTGDDLLDGGPGDDSIDGGDGNDTAVFTGARDAYVVTDLGSGMILIEGPDGADTFLNVESFAFSDLTQTVAEVVLPRLANLATSDVMISDSSLAQGEAADVLVSVISDGTVDAGNNRAELVWATAPDAGAIGGVLESYDLGNIATGTSTELIANIEAGDLAPGTYYVALRVDVDNSIVEGSEADNLSGWTEITIEPPVTDLSFSRILVSGVSDFDLARTGRLLLTYDVENKSNTGSGEFQITTVLSRDATISADDILVSTQNHILAGGSTSYFADNISLAEDFEGGDWYILSAIDWTGGGNRRHSVGQHCGCSYHTNGDKLRHHCICVVD